ncbi:hypothetical protein F4824DRAFT_468358 [Ustulina deusta]|nr:hypothetical protein F4824DRAFT_468358 [Ustulina deusta]
MIRSWNRSSLHRVCAFFFVLLLLLLSFPRARMPTTCIVNPLTGSLAYSLQKCSADLVGTSRVPPIRSMTQARLCLIVSLSHPYFYFWEITWHLSQCLCSDWAN